MPNKNSMNPVALKGLGLYISEVIRNKQAYEEAEDLRRRAFFFMGGHAEKKNLKSHMMILIKILTTM